MKKYSKYPTPSHDPQTGIKNPYYPEFACESCCESNLEEFYDSNEESRERLYNQRRMPDSHSYRRCIVCGNDAVLYSTESYGYPKFHMRL